MEKAKHKISPEDGNITKFDIGLLILAACFIILGLSSILDKPEVGKENNPTKEHVQQTKASDRS